MADELGDGTQTLRTLHTVFTAQVAHGALAVDVEVLRRGRSMSHVRAEARNPGTPRGHVTTAAFGASRPGFSFTDLLPPADVPPPEECPSFRDPLPPEAGAFEPAPVWTTPLEGRPPP